MKIANPLREMIVKYDSVECGRFGAKLKGKNNYSTETQLRAEAGEPVFALFDGMISKQVLFMQGDNRFSGLNLLSEDKQYIARYTFITPLRAKVGHAVSAGELIGHAQDVSMIEPKKRSYIAIELHKVTPTQKTAVDVMELLSLTPNTSNNG